MLARRAGASVRRANPSDQEAAMIASKSDPLRSNGAASRLRVEDAMHRGVLVRPRETPLSELARLMADYHVHSVVVADDPSDAGTLWGVVSDLDLVAAASVRDLDEQEAGATAATPALLVSPDESLLRAAQLITEHAVTHLVVVEPTTATPVGVLSTLDIARALAP
jgi:CBS domain-containing protein